MRKEVSDNGRGRPVWALLLLGLAGVGLWWQGRDVERGWDGVHSLGGAALGTSWVLTVPDLERRFEAMELRAAVEGALAEVDRVASTWRDDSELSALNAKLAAQRERPLEARVSAVFAEIWTLAVRAHRLTAGNFDPRVGDLVGASGFGAEAGRDALDSAERGPLPEIQRASGGEASIDFGVAPMNLDLSGVAKGFAVDLGVERLDALGVGSLFFEVGGEIICRGASPRGDAWRVGVDRPSETPDAPRAALLALEVDGFGVATSGDYRDWRELDGERVTHIVDPHSGVALGGVALGEAALGGDSAESPRSTPASVTVIAESCGLADALATGLMILEPQAALAAVDSEPGVECLLLIRDPEQPGNFIELESAGFARFRAASK